MILADTSGERSRPWGSLLNRHSRLSHGTDSESRDLSETQFSQLSLCTFAVMNSFHEGGCFPEQSSSSFHPALECL